MFCFRFHDNNQGFQSVSIKLVNVKSTEKMILNTPKNPFASSDSKRDRNYISAEN